jgi:HK97 family phage major capsid protein
MTKQDYLAQRNALIAEAEALINKGELEEAEQKRGEVEALDQKYDEIAKAQANLNAMKDKSVVKDAVEMQEEKVVVKPAEAVDEKKMYLNAWGKVMMGMSLTGDERNVFDKVNMTIQNTTQTAATHAVVIPETVAETIWKEAADLYPIIKDVNMTFVPGDLTILQETSSGDAAAWYDEATTVADGDFTVGELNLTGCELAKAIPISWKLRKMSIERFIPYITSLLAEKMGAALAAGIVNGKGKPGTTDTFKPEPKGIVTAIEAEANTPQIVTYDANGIVYDTLADAMAKIKSAYKTGAAIYADSATIWGKLAQIKDANGRPIFIADATGNGVGRIFGILVKEEDGVDEGEVLIGNVRNGYAANVNENMTIYTEDHVKARYTDYMSYAIIDGAPLTTKAFALIKPVA